MPKVSVIVPIYNVEKYLERCVRSLFEQTLDDIEYIFVNDCTPDNSISLLERIANEYPNRVPQVKIIHHTQNLGLSEARATGMNAMTGEYHIHCDSDDWVEPDMYELMYNQAIKTNADIVVCDFVHEFKDSQRENHYEPIKNPHKCITSDNGTQWWTCWNRLVKTSLITRHSIRPISRINMLEDLYLMMNVYYFANVVEYVPKCLYHYNRCNQSSIIATSYSASVLSQKIHTLKSLETFFRDKNFIIPNTIILNKISTRDQFLLLKPRDFSAWRKTFPEIVPLITTNKDLNILYRICYKIASFGFYFPLYIYIKLHTIKH